MSIPIYSSIRERYPNAKIFSTVKTDAAISLLKGQGLADDFIKSDFYNINFFKKVRWFFEILFFNFDLIVSPANVNIRNSIIIKLLTLTKYNIASHNNLYSLFITDQVNLKKTDNRVENNKKLAKKFIDNPPNPSLEVILNPIDVFKKFDIPYESNIVGIHPGCGDLEKHKRWPSSNYASLINKINNQQDAFIVLFGVKNEIDTCEKILQAVDNCKNIISIAGLSSINETIAIISKCSFFISGDSGLMHLAASLNITTFSIFGPTSTNELAPRWNNSNVITNSLSCSPCYPRLPNGCGNPVCMTNINASQVFERIINI